MASVQTDLLDKFKVARQRHEAAQAALVAAQDSHSSRPTPDSAAQLQQAQAQARAALHAFNDAAKAARDYLS